MQHGQCGPCAAAEASLSANLSLVQFMDNGLEQKRTAIPCYVDAGGYVQVLLSPSSRSEDVVTGIAAKKARQRSVEGTHWPGFLS